MKRKKVDEYDAVKASTNNNNGTYTKFLVVGKKTLDIVYAVGGWRISLFFICFFCSAFSSISVPLMVRTNKKSKKKRHRLETRSWWIGVRYVYLCSSSEERNCMNMNVYSGSPLFTLKIYHPVQGKMIEFEAILNGTNTKWMKKRKKKYETVDFMFVFCWTLWTSYNSLSFGLKA